MEKITSREKELRLERYGRLKILSPKQIQIIEKYAEDEDWSVRIEVAKILGNFQNNSSKRILLKLANDQDELIRIEAYDSLSVFDTKDVEYALKKAIQTERKSLACSYAIMAWAEVVIARRRIPWKQSLFITNFKKKQRIQKSEHCLLNSCYAQYIFGRKKALKEILKLLKSDDYRIRCSVLNTLAWIVDERNQLVIQKAIQTLLVKGDVRAVTSTAERILKEKFGK